MTDRTKSKSFPVAGFSAISDTPFTVFSGENISTSYHMKSTKQTFGDDLILPVKPSTIPLLIVSVVFDLFSFHLFVVLSQADNIQILLSQSAQHLHDQDESRQKVFEHAMPSTYTNLLLSFLAAKTEFAKRLRQTHSPHSCGFQNLTRLIREQHREETLPVRSEQLLFHASPRSGNPFVAQDIEPHFDLPSRDVL